MNEHIKRILLVDDDELILESLKSALEDRGYEVFLARDGSEALMRAERDAPDLIVLDVIMPIRSGYSVLDHLHRNRTHTPPVIMMTANEDERLRGYAESRGANAFLQKPFEISQLLSKVETLLNA
jgi:two-component system alkaline phosphatase synthesis response regulator PhoP